MRVIHFAPLSCDFASGLNHSIPALVKAQAEEGLNVALISTGSSPLMPVEPGLESYWHLAKGLNIHRQIEESDLVVFHSTYIPSHLKYARLARKLKKPYVVTPRGGLTTGAAKSSRFKKMVADQLFVRSYVRNASAVHCLTPREASESAHWHSNIFIVGNGVNIPNIGGISEFKKSQKPLKIVNIGRLSVYHKGLDRMIAGVANYRTAFGQKDFMLTLYGPDDAGGRMELERVVREQGLDKMVAFEDAVFGEAKQAVLRAASGFIMTSRFEGQPMAALEALSYGLPCLLSDGTHLAEYVEDAGAGLRCPSLAPSDIAMTLHRFVSASEDARQKMSQCARNIAEKFDWNSIARQTIAKYKLIMDSNAVFQ